ncbi:MAG TPA: hypothetical protein DD434_06530 [Bacteroidales bacterium]|nr:hypothetical protein [Bacteroidales bacterium]
MEYNNKMSIVVLSCDAYSDLWDDFFNLKEKYWPNCNFQCYLVNNNKHYNRDGVVVINAGQGNWSSRFRIAVEQIESEYICTFLEDYFITDTINNNLINELLDFSENNKVSFLNLGDVFGHIINLKNLEYFSPNQIIIPKHLKYGVDTAGAIWDKQYLLRKLGKGDYSAWQFEKDRCIEALSNEGIDGLILCDDRKPLNICEIPVVIQGKFYPPAIRFFKKKGYSINHSQRKIMTIKDVFMYKFKNSFAKIKFCRKTIKKLASVFMGYKFVTED